MGFQSLKTYFSK